MYSEYFDAIVKDKYIESKDVIKSRGFLKWKKTIIITEKKFYLECLLNGNNDFILKIEVNEKVYNAAYIDAKLSVKLNFEYKFSCFHFLPYENKINTILVKEK